MGVLNLLLFFLSMFWRTDGGPPPDGSGAGDSGAGGAGTGDGDSGAGGAGAEGSGGSKTFNQAEVDRIVRERLARERAQYADYEDLKKKAEAHDAAVEAQKTADQKAAEEAAKRERETADKVAAADRRLIAAEIKEQASGRVWNPDHVVTLLASDPTIKVKGDQVEGVKDALDRLLGDPKNEYLVKKDGGASRSGGEFGGKDSKTLPEQIAEAEAAGDWKKANALKMEQLRTLRQ